MVKRELYMQKIRRLINKDIIKVITGVRRSGKSYLLGMIIDELKKKGIDKDNILLINFDSPEFSSIKNCDDLNDYVLKFSKDKTEKIYLLLDEIQEVSQWEKSIAGFFAMDMFDIYITGSNSKLLSGELATLLTGRYMEIKIYPFSFNEFINYKQELNTYENNLNELFNEYVAYGGFPFTIKLETNNDKIEYIRDLYNSIFYNDLIKRYNITNTGLLEKILEYIIENIGNLITVKSIVNYLKHENIRFSRNTIYNYLSYFENTLLISRVKKEDIKGKKLLGIQEKDYLVDTGIIRSVLGKNHINIGRIYENIVYLEFLRHDYEITIGTLNNNEVDFICRKGNDKCYVQVSYLLADEDIEEREYRPLLEIKDNYPKYIITMDTVDLSKEGIIHRNLIDFLINFI